MFQIGTITPMVLTNAFLSFNLFLIFVLTLFSAVTVNVAPFSAYKTHNLQFFTLLKVCMYDFYGQKLACSTLIVLIFISCEYKSHALVKYEPSIFPTFPNHIYNHFWNSVFYFS